MSFLDMDELLIELADKMELVYSPLADVKIFPVDVNVTLVEGAVTNDENEEFAHLIRRNSRMVVSFGDCATTGNVTALRNRFENADIERRAYVELADRNKAVPLHEVVKVDAFLHGCPPTADEIWHAVNELLQGKKPVLPPAYMRFG